MKKGLPIFPKGTKLRADINLYNFSNNAQRVTVKGVVYKVTKSDSVSFTISNGLSWTLGTNEAKHFTIIDK